MLFLIAQVLWCLCCLVLCYIFSLDLALVKVVCKMCKLFDRKKSLNKYKKFNHNEISRKKEHVEIQGSIKKELKFSGWGVPELKIHVEFLWILVFDLQISNKGCYQNFQVFDLEISATRGVIIRFCRISRVLKACFLQNFQG